MVAPRPVADWIVELRGDSEFIAILAKAFPANDPTVCTEADRHFLRSPIFLEHRDALEVLNSANSMLSRMSGLINLASGFAGDVQAVSAQWVDHDGRKGGIGPVADLHGRVVNRRALEAFLKPRPDGSSQPRELLLRTRDDPAVDAALFVLGSRDPSWPDLYVLYEIVEDSVGGPKHVRELAGVSRNELTSFCATADLHRHARSGIANTGRPPEMPFHEALGLVRHILKRWLGIASDLPSNSSLQRTLNSYR